MLKSPLMFGGAVIKMDNFTQMLLTNKDVLAIDEKSENTTWVWDKNNFTAISAKHPTNPNTLYVALFNRGDHGPSTIAISWMDLGLPRDVVCVVKDLWTQKDLGMFMNSFSQPINSHGVGLFSFSC